MATNPTDATSKKDAGDKPTDVQSEKATERAKTEVDANREEFQEKEKADPSRTYEQGRPRNRFSVTNPLPEGFFETLKQAQALHREEQKQNGRLLKDAAPGEAKNANGAATDASQQKLCISGNAQVDISRISRILEVPKSKVEGQLDKADQSAVHEKLSTLTGELKSPDGRVVKVDQGKILNANGESIGDITAKGQILKDGSAAGVNSDFDRWTFTGNENGQARHFVCDRNMSSGKMFLEMGPNNKVECDVRMGMVIEKESGKQIANLSAPTETTDGKLTGGSLTFFETPPGKVALADMKNSSFDLELLGQTGVESRRLQGVCLGPQKLADGRPDPEKGGLFNINEGREVLSKHKNEVQAKVDNAGTISKLTGSDQKDISDLDRTKQRIDALDTVLKTGDLKDLNFARYGIAEQKEINDPILAARQKADSKDERLESLPNDMSKLNGSVKIAVDKGNGEKTVETHTIKDGIVLDENQKPLFKMSNEDGQMMLSKIDSPSDRLPAQKLAGAVWNMSNPESGEKLQWISHGDRFISKQDLAQRSQNSLEYTKVLNANSGSEDSANRELATMQAQTQYLQKLNALFENGVTKNEDLKWIAAGPREVHERATEHGDLVKSATDARSQRRIDIPIFVGENDKSDSSQNRFHVSDVKSGELRIGNELYKIGAGGKLSQNGKDVGNLTAGYEAEINGSKIDLANTNRVLMQFELEGDARNHKILSLGPERISEDGRKIQGGLVHHDQLLREGLECRQKAREGDRDYFAKKPYLNTWLGSMGADSFDSFDKDLDTFAKNIDTQVGNLTKQVDKLFEEGFKEDFGNNAVDSTIKSTQNLVSGLSFTSLSAAETARDATAAQKQINDAMVTGVITVVTGGLGSWAAAGHAAETLTVTTAAGRALLAKTALTAGTTGMVAGGAISGLGRMSSESNDTANVVSGSMEGLSNALGSVGGTWLNAAKSRQLGAGAELLYRSSEAVTQTVMNTLAGAIRENDPNAMSMKGMLAGSLAQLGTGYAGVGLAKLSQNLAHALSDRMGNNLQKAAEVLGLGSGDDVLRGIAHNSDAMTDALRSKGFTPDQLSKLQLEVSLLKGVDTISDAANSGLNGYANGVCGAIPAAFEAQKEKIAAKYGINVSEVKGALYDSNIDYGEVAEYLHESGVDAMKTAVGTAAIARPVNQKVEAHYDVVGRSAVEHASAPPTIAEFMRAEQSRLTVEAGGSLRERLKANNAEGADNRGGLLQRLKQSEGIPENNSKQHERGPEFKQIKNPDESISWESSIHKGRIELDDDNNISDLIESNGNRLSIERDSDGEPIEISSYDGDYWEKGDDGDWVIQHKLGYKERTEDVKVHDDGSIEYTSAGRNVLRKLDGSVREDGRLIKADLSTEQTKLKNVLDGLPESIDQKFAKVMLDAVATRREIMRWSGTETAAALHEVTEILSAKNSKLSLETRSELAVEILGNILDCNAITQGAHPTCNATDVSMQMFSRKPSEAVRLLKEAILTGEVDVLGGKVKLTKNDLSHDRESRKAHQQELFQGGKPKEGSALHGERNLADKILQTVIVNAHWISQGHDHNKNQVERGSIRYEHDATGQARLMHNGKEISDSPELSANALQTLYKDLTFSTDKILLVHDEFGMSASNGARYDSEEGFQKILEQMKPSIGNPLIFMMNCSGEPFYTDSNGFKAGGSEGLHVVNIVGGPVDINGEPHVYVSNTWGKDTQHTQDSGKPIKLHDLYLAGMPIESQKRIEALAIESVNSPFRQMEYLRALETSNKTMESIAERFSNRFPGKSKAEIISELRKASNETPGISKEEHLKLVRDLKNSLSNKPDAWSHIKPEERQKAIEHARATIARLEDDIADSAAASKSKPDSAKSVNEFIESRRTPRVDSFRSDGDNTNPTKKADPAFEKVKAHFEKLGKQVQPGPDGKPQVKDIHEMIVQNEKAIQGYEQSFSIDPDKALQRQLDKARSEALTLNNMLFQQGFQRQTFGKDSYVVDTKVKLEGTPEPLNVIRSINRPQNVGGDPNSNKIMDAIRSNQDLPDYLPRGGENAPIKLSDVVDYTNSAPDKSGVTAVSTDINFVLSRAQVGDIVILAHLEQGSPIVTSQKQVTKGLPGEAQILVPKIRADQYSQISEVVIDPNTGQKRLQRLWNRPPSSP